MEAHGATTQPTTSMQPPLAIMERRRPDLASPHPWIPRDFEHQREVKKLRRDLGNLAWEVDQQTEQLIYQTARIDNIAGHITGMAQEAKTAAVAATEAAALSNTLVQKLLNKNETAS